MDRHVSIPLIGGGYRDFDLEPGGLTVVLGANGSGKSALGAWLLNQPSELRRHRLIAHRQLWMEDSHSNLSSYQVQGYGENLKQEDRQFSSRWRDPYVSYRSPIALEQLIQLEADHNSQLAQEAKDAAAANRPPVISGSSPLDLLNDALADAGLGVKFIYEPKTGRYAVVSDGIEVPLNEASDGERAAVVLTADVLSKPEVDVFVLDEPERHLHRAVSPRLIQALSSRLQGAHLFVLTHDLEFANAVPADTVVVLRRVEWTDKDPRAWDAELVRDLAGVDDSVRRAITGGRRRVLCVEGEGSSLDRMLYSILFPTWDVVSVGSCANVLRSVKALHAMRTFHWLETRGIIDRDGRGLGVRASGRELGDEVLVLKVSEIESALYLPVVLEAVAAAQTRTLGGIASELVGAAKAAALHSLTQESTRAKLATGLALKVMREEANLMVAELRDSGVAGQGKTFRLEAPYEKIRANLDKAIRDGDYDSVVRHFPVRDSGWQNAVARALKFQGAADYVKATLNQIQLSLPLRGDVVAGIGLRALMDEELALSSGVAESGPREAGL